MVISKINNQLTCLIPRSLLIAALLCFQQIASANPDDTIKNELTTEQPRPKIGLVLSGGGARGIAHIGVLKVLENNHVPIDFVVGTSAGSIIGGLYAIGLSPTEIEQGIASIDWENVFHDFAYREYKTFRRKQDDFDFFNIHRVGITDNGLQLSPGLIEGQQIEIALDRLAYPAFHLNDYDKFSIPFRAVATDIETGKPFIISSGNLARAMRASMSVPGALPAISIDDTLLVDGGIANNIPIDIARKMGADVVIVIDVSEALAPKEEMRSSVAVTGQLTTIMTRRIADIQLESLTDRDLLITPGSDNVGAADFELYKQSIASGKAAALRNLEAIQRLSISPEEYQHYKSSLPKVAKKSPVIDFIEINNKTVLNDNIIRQRIHQKLGEVLDVQQLEKDLAYIYGLDYSGSVVYSLEERDGKTGLIVYARGRDWANSYLQFGLSIKSESNIGSYTNFDTAYVKHNLNHLAGEFRATAGLGTEPSLSAEIYQPVNDELDIHVSAKAGINTTIFPTISNGNVDSLERFHRTYIKLGIGKTFKQTSQLHLLYKQNKGRTVTISGQSSFADGDFNEGYLRTGFFHDSLDNLSFPNSGFFGGLTYRVARKDFGDDTDYEQARLILSGASTYDRYTVFTRALLETTIDENAPFNALFRNGGFLELSGTLDRELAGQHFGLIEAAFYRRLGDITFLPIYAGFSVEAGNAWDRYDDITSENINLAGSIFVGADTFIGPLYLAFGLTESGSHALYFNLGQTFMDIEF